MQFAVNGYYTLILATMVLFVGRFLVRRIQFLEDFSIPEPVAGGLLAAIVVTGLNLFFGYQFNFQSQLQTACMLMFFSSIGLSADFGRLKSGGIPLVLFIILVSVFIILQNSMGIALALMTGIEPMLGLVTGSIALVGGHGTAAAWGATLENQHGVVGATTLGIAAATYGLVAGGIIGGPIGRRLINKLNIQPNATNASLQEQSTDAPKSNRIDERKNQDIFEKSDNIRLITATSAIETLALFAGCLGFAEFMTMLFEGTKYQLPMFVWALMGGVIIRNTLTTFFKFNMFDRAIDVFGNASLSLFLAIALMSLKLWDLADLAGTVIIILVIQTILMIAFAYFVTFRVMGKDYDAAVLAAGHCGFGLGATPTAIANMQAITDRYMPSHKAFLIVPMVGAFFVDIVNALILHWLTTMPFMSN